MSPQRNYEVVDPITSVISCQDYRLILPIVLFRVPVATMLAHLTTKNICNYNLRSAFTLQVYQIFTCAS